MSSPRQNGGTWNASEMSADAIEDEIAGIRMKIVDYDHLVLLKELAGRPEDVADLIRLREARGE